jgi:hypothetical protein
MIQRKKFLPFSRKNVVVNLHDVINSSIDKPYRFGDYYEHHEETHQNCCEEIYGLNEKEPEW